MMNTVVPPENTRGRCSFLGFDLNRSTIDRAAIIAANFGHTDCRFEVGDVAEVRALARDRRIHLNNFFPAYPFSSSSFLAIKRHPLQA
jgi:hypothetical protein